MQAYYEELDNFHTSTLPHFVLFADLKSMMAAADLHYKHNERCCLFCGIRKQYVGVVLKEPNRETNLCHHLDERYVVGLLKLSEG